MLAVDCAPIVMASADLDEAPVAEPLPVRLIKPAGFLLPLTAPPDPPDSPLSSPPDPPLPLLLSSSPDSSPPGFGEAFFSHLA